MCGDVDITHVPKHSTLHRIKTAGQPVFCHPRQLGPEKLAVARTVFNELLEKGIIQPSKSQWASPLHMASKKDLTWRPCGDYSNEKKLVAAVKIVYMICLL